MSFSFHPSILTTFRNRNTFRNSLNPKDLYQREAEGTHMSFNSLYFIIFFLPLTLAAYYLTAAKSRAAADWVLVGASVIFYGFADVWYPVMLGILIAMNWGITFMIRRSKAPSSPAAAERSAVAAADEAAAAASPARADNSPTANEDSLTAEGSASNGKRNGAEAAQRDSAKAWMILGVVVNVAILGVFKYTNFFIENLNALLGADWATVNLILPLGISFIIFSQISWIVDSYRGSTKDVCLREYVVYSSFFPKLSQGPITLMRDFLPQLRREDRHRFDDESMMIGIQMFVCGLAKKILLADVLGESVEWYFDMLEYQTNVDTYIILLTYVLQLYFDFSGYSDMALGVSKMLGFDLPANFNSPYKACSVTEVWKRWHISLTTFLREYVYFPLGGSRKGTARTYLNIMIVYLVSGLWHGASWTYVLWGAMQGVAQSLEKAIGKFYFKIWKPIRWAITFAFVNVTWMIFRCGDLTTFRRFWWHLTVDKTWTLSADLAANYRLPGIRLILSLVGLPSGDGFVNILSLVLLLGLGLFIVLALPNNQERKYRSSISSLLITAVLLCICLLSLSSASTFVYNDF